MRILPNKVEKVRSGFFGNYSKIREERNKLRREIVNKKKPEPDDLKNSQPSLERKPWILDHLGYITRGSNQPSLQKLGTEVMADIPI